MGEEWLKNKRNEIGEKEGQKRENIKLFCNNGTYPQQNTKCHMR
jgi:hypothetical protein